MFKRIVILLLIVLLPAAFAGCKGYEEPAQGPIKKAPQPKPAAPPAVKKAKKPLAELTGKSRNPFQSHLLTERQNAAKAKIKGPLECCQLDLFVVKAVVGAGSNPYALVLAPSGKRYVVRLGDVMGASEGVIVSIDSRGVTVREQQKAAGGAVLSTNDVVVPLQKVATKKKR